MLIIYIIPLEVVKKENDLIMLVLMSILVDRQKTPLSSSLEDSI